MGAIITTQLSKIIDGYIQAAYGANVACCTLFDNSTDFESLLL